MKLVAHHEINPAKHPWHIAKTTPDKPALIMANSGDILTYGQLVERSHKTVNLYASLGLTTGDTIAVLMENNLYYPEICWAAKNYGLHYACLSTHLNASDLSYILSNSDANVLVISRVQLDKYETVLKNHQTLKILVIQNAQFSKSDGIIDYHELHDQQPMTPRPPVRGASMLYSSGTTGRPKGIKVNISKHERPETPPPRHATLVNSFAFGPDMIFLNPGPFYHAAPLRMMMAAHREGGTVIGFDKFDALSTLNALQQYQATHGFFVPTMFSRFLNLPIASRNGIDISSIKVALHGAAPCPTPTKHAMLKWWGKTIYELYGGTEGMGQTAISPQEWLAHEGSVGKAGIGCNVKIIDENGMPLPTGETGSVYMKNGRIFEYHNDIEKTKSAYLDDGFSTLGDIGHLDEEGYLYLTDRQSDMIISGGVNIYPRESENVLILHEHVEDVAVIGIPDPDFGEQVKALIVLKPPQKISLEMERNILQFCKNHLSHIKCPKSIDFVRSIARNESGKILKKTIKQKYWPAPMQTHNNQQKDQYDLSE